MTTLANIQAIKIENNRIELSVNNDNKPVARHYRILTAGKNKGEKKLVNGFYFATEERRAEYVTELVTRLNNNAAEKQKQEEVKKEVSAKFDHPFTVGMVLYSSWGYEQTNIDFYQVTEIKGKQLKLKEISGTLVSNGGHDYGYTKPVVDSFEGEEIKKNIQFYLNSKNEAHFYVKMDGVRGHLSQYDGGEKGVYCSWGY